jgi:hypothetical protein
MVNAWPVGLSSIMRRGADTLSLLFVRRRAGRDISRIYALLTAESFYVIVLPLLSSVPSRGTT